MCACAAKECAHVALVHRMQIGRLADGNGTVLGHSDCVMHKHFNYQRADTHTRTLPNMHNVVVVVVVVL